MNKMFMINIMRYFIIEYFIDEVFYKLQDVALSAGDILYIWISDMKHCQGENSAWRLLNSVFCIEPTGIHSSTRQFKYSIFKRWSIEHLLNSIYHHYFFCNYHYIYNYNRFAFSIFRSCTMGRQDLTIIGARPRNQSV